MGMKRINFNIVRYIIPNYKLNKETKVLLIADLHNYTEKRHEACLLAEKIKEINPHHLVIAGDILQGKGWENIKVRNNLKIFLDNISESVSIFLSLGNHDLDGCHNNYDKRMKSFSELSINRSNIYPLINDKVTIDDFQIVGYTPNYTILSNMALFEHGLAHDRFISEYMEKGIKLEKSNKQVEFVGHNPYLFAQSENGIGLGNLKYVDTFYTGHLHNGYYHLRTTNANPDKYLDRGYNELLYNLKNNGKLENINCLLLSKVGLCRGIVFIDELSNKVILNLSNNCFFINQSQEINKTKWIKMNNSEAIKMIINQKLHALVITGGIRKFSYFDFLNDEPELTEIVYKKIIK